MAKTKVTGEYLKDSVVRFTAKAGENITKGNAVYISGISGELPVVSLADADDTAKMPAFGLAEATVSTNAEVEVTSFGTLANLDTSSYTLGDILYVDTTAGALTNDPAGLEATKLQNIGIVQRVHASNGSIKVGGAGRTNAVPNLDDGDIFIGDSNNKAVSSALSTEIESYLDGGTSTPTFASATVSGDLTVDTDTLYVDSTNNRVGIGTTGPSNILDVQTSITTTGLRFQHTANTNNTAGIFMQNDASDVIRMRVTRSGAGGASILEASNSLEVTTGGSLGLAIDGSQNVGIGTNTPNAMLELIRGASNGAAGPSIRMGREDNSTVANDSLGILEFYTSDTSNGPGVAASIQGLQNGTGSAADILFSTGNVATTTERMRINSLGNVGIGTDDPSAKLEVNDAIQITDTSGDPFLKLATSEREYVVRIDNDDSDKFQIRDVTGASTRVTLDTSGNVGIGIGNPAEKLEVAGSIKSTARAIAGSETPGVTLSYDSSNSIGKLETWTSKPFSIETAGQERIRILAGGGLTFNGDTAAANALDDYEEGTWTPKYNSVTNFSAAHGHYQKIGNRVFFSFYIQMFSSSNGNRFQCVGLPFNTTDFSTNPEDDANRGFMTIGYTTYGSAFTVLLDSPSTDTFAAYTYGGAGITLAQLSGKAIYGAGSYITSS